jgi:pimeloyl-ACP methyl ester carboxylesterase
MASKRIYKPAEKLYPFTGQRLDVRGHSMHYLDEGPSDAPLVLMLHGNPSWSFYYRKLVLALRDQYRCIVPDHIGCGLSDKPDAQTYDYHLASRIEDIETLLDHVDPKRPVILVVHDWGGMIGMSWAVRHPERVAGLVILNTAAFPLPADKRMPVALSLTRNTALGSWLVLQLNAFAGMAARVGFKKKVSKEVREAYTAPYDSPANRIATLRFVQDIPLQENDPGFDILLKTAEHLHLFSKLPCLIAWGEKDFVFDHSFLQEWLKIYPQAEVHRFADCGHYILEDGGDALIDTIRNFIHNKDDTTHGQAVE